ncbi:MAG TPA: hypothetical protein VN420_05675 [Candidatus Fimivivens sp.]|nr:hypothetical protein [Candidatus Fimivivens sp.]
MKPNNERLTVNSHSPRGVYGKVFQEIAIEDGLFRGYRVLAAGGSTGALILIAMHEKKIFLFEFPITSGGGGDGSSPLYILQAVPESFLVELARKDSSTLSFSLWQDLTLKPIAADDPAFFAPGPSRYENRIRQDSVSTMSPRIYVICESPSRKGHFKQRRLRKNADYRIAAAGKLKNHKDYFVILKEGSGYVLLGIPESLAAPLWDRVKQGSYSVRISDEQGFDFPVITRTR